MFICVDMTWYAISTGLFHIFYYIFLLFFIAYNFFCLCIHLYIVQNFLGMHDSLCVCWEGAKIWNLAWGANIARAGPVCCSHYVFSMSDICVALRRVVQLLKSSPLRQSDTNILFRTSHRCLPGPLPAGFCLWHTFTVAFDFRRKPFTTGASSLLAAWGANLLKDIHRVMHVLCVVYKQHVPSLY